MVFLFIAGCHTNDTTTEKTEIADSAYAIIGKITGQDSGMVYILHQQSGRFDSAKLDHGYFKFAGRADTPEYCRLSPSLNKGSVSFFLENGKISMLIKKDSLEYALISGTKTQDEFVYYQNTFTKTLNDRMSALDKAYEAANARKDKKTMDSMNIVYEELDVEQKNLVAEFTKSHPASYVSAFEVFSNFSYNPNVSQLDSLLQILDTGLRSSYYGKKIAYTLEKEKLTGIGKPAPDFSIKNANGKPVSLSTFRGNWVLLDFWASWCGPCRQENPSVVKAYHEFHHKGFDILGVSLDHDKVKWVDAIKKDGLNWEQVSDLDGWKAGVVSLYGIQGIPMNYLLDKNGIIVAKGLRGEDLTKKLQELIH